MNASHNNRDRLMDLLTDQALFGVSDSEKMELRELLLENPDVDGESMDRVAALVEVSNIGSEVPSLPPGLEERIRSSVLGEHRTSKAEEQGEVIRSLPAGQVALPSTDMTTERTRRSVAGYLLGVSGWVIAGTLLVAMAFPQLLTGPNSGNPEPTLAQLRDDLLQSKPNAIQSSWSRTEDDSAKNASGEIVWDNDGQQGFMTFEGLAANDPSKYQYQLWIFDDEQKHPVDGGVFDIEDEGSKAIIPINAKIKVRKPTLFAVTIERPGGVVVSDRERIAVTASPAP